MPGEELCRFYFLVSILKKTFWKMGEMGRFLEAGYKCLRLNRLCTKEGEWDNPYPFQSPRPGENRFIFARPPSDFLPVLPDFLAFSPDICILFGLAYCI
jgi:hypothetical protein